MLGIKKELINKENIFYTTILGFFYLIGLTSIAKNFIFLLNNQDFDHFLYLLIGLFFWIIFAFVYIEKLKYFTNIKPEKDKDFILKPKNDYEHMIYFFIQIYILISFFVIFIQWHNTIDIILKKESYFKIGIFFFAFIPFLLDAFRLNKKIFSYIVIILLFMFSLIYFDFFKYGCYQMNENGLKYYIVDCI